jgi:hypothetical protein
MDARIFDHWPDYSQSCRWPYRSRNVGRNIVAHTSWELWIGIAELSVLCRRSQVPIRLPWRLRYCPTIASSAPRAFDRNYQGYPKLSPLIGASVPRFGIISHRHAAPKLGLAREFPPVAARLAFPHRIGKLPLSCGISLTWKHAAVRLCTGFDSVVERGGRRIRRMINACCGLRLWDYAISGQMRDL